MDWSNPDYKGILIKRTKLLDVLKSDPDKLAAAKIHYKSHPADFINDWGMAYDPRRSEKDLHPNVPFILWPRQKEYVEWVYERWRSSERGLVEKTRDCGATWLSVGVAVCLWCFHDGVSIGFGSRSEDLVDRLGDPDSIFEKIRHFVRHVPKMLLPEGYNEDKHSLFKRLISPAGASITGHIGQDIGRGGRKSMVFVDEAAFIANQESTDSALSQNTNCQIDISTFNGAGNEFYKKQQRFKGTSRHFVFDWRDDPRKDDTWYQQQKEEQSEQTVAQEIDRDPLASATDSFIPAKWLRATIDAHIKLGFEPTGIKVAGFDPADTGDAKGFVFRHGSVITVADQMVKGDITTALPWAFSMADQNRASVFSFDADGLGAPVIKTYLMSATAGDMQIAEYRGSGEIEDKKKKHTEGGLSRNNEDTYLNFRSQSWAWFRERCEATYNAIERHSKGVLVNVDPEDLISISSECVEYDALISELSQPRRIWTNNGKIAVESKKAMKARGVSSPNLADAAIVAMSVRKIKTSNRQSVLDRYVPHTITDRAAGY